MKDLGIGLYGFRRYRRERQWATWCIWMEWEVKRSGVEERKKKEIEQTQTVGTSSGPNKEKSKVRMRGEQKKRGCAWKNCDFALPRRSRCG